MLAGDRIVTSDGCMEQEEGTKYGEHPNRCKSGIEEISASDYTAIHVPPVPVTEFFNKNQ